MLGYLVFISHLILILPFVLTFLTPDKFDLVPSIAAGAGFFKKDGLLYRRWIPPGCSVEEMAVIGVPFQRIAIPLAGHLGKYKTARRILQRFYWPTLYKDVQESCRPC